jgi:hypothetical protein
MNVTASCVICKSTVEVDVRVFNDRPTVRCSDCIELIDQTRGDTPARILGRLA